MEALLSVDEADGRSLRTYLVFLPDVEGIITAVSLGWNIKALLRR